MLFRTLLSAVLLPGPGPPTSLHGADPGRSDEADAGTWPGIRAWSSSSRCTRRTHRVGIYYNTAAVIDAEGSTSASTAAHPHVKGFWRSSTSGRHPGLPVFETAVGKVGVYICYDRHIPEGAGPGLNGAENRPLPSHPARLSEYSAGRAGVPCRRQRLLRRTINRVGIEKEIGDDDFTGRATSAIRGAGRRRRGHRRRGARGPRLDLDLVTRSARPGSSNRDRRRRPRRPRPALTAAADGGPRWSSASPQAGSLDPADDRPGPPARRRLAYGWLFDSHVLWRDPYPAADPHRPGHDDAAAGHLRHEPATREPSVTASTLASSRTLGRRFRLGIGRGDSARRSSQEPTTIASLEEGSRDPGLAEGRPIEYEGATLQLTWSGAIPPRLDRGYGPVALR